jgi:hypothetical protein
VGGEAAETCKSHTCAAGGGLNSAMCMVPFAIKLTVCWWKQRCEVQRPELFCGMIHVVPMHKDADSPLGMTHTKHVWV